MRDVHSEGFVNENLNEQKEDFLELFNQRLTTVPITAFWSKKKEKESLKKSGEKKARQ